MRKPLLKKLFIGFLVVIGLLIIGWGGLLLYVSKNETRLIRFAEKELGDRLEGNLIIKDASLSILKGFPNIAIDLSDITLTDSLFHLHQHQILNLSHLYININALDLLKRKMTVKSFYLEGGTIDLYTDSLGYSNFNGLFKEKKKDPNEKEKDFEVSKLDFADITLKLQDDQKAKLFEFDISRLRSHSQLKNKKWTSVLSGSLEIREMVFNREKGSFLKDAVMEISDMKVEYLPGEKKMAVVNQVIDIDNNPMSISTSMDFSTKPVAFTIQMENKTADMKQAMEWLSPGISRKIDMIKVTKPMAVSAFVEGKFKFRDTPYVRVTFEAINNEIKSPMANFTDCNFKGEFNNVVTEGKGHGDPNSVVVLRTVSAKWRGLPVKADSIRLSDLSNPLLETKISSSFPLSKLNNVSKSIPFSFSEGTAKLLIYYKGGVKKNDTTRPEIDGRIAIKDGKLNYTPRNLNLYGTTAIIDFKNNDLFFRELSTRTAKSDLKLTGKALNFFKFYFDNPGNIVISWDVNSQYLYLADFISFLGKRGKLEYKTEKEKTNLAADKVLTQLDRVLNESTVELNARLNNILYKNFLATKFKASASLGQSAIHLNKVSLQHANGTINADAHIYQDQTMNPFKVHASLLKLDIDKTFFAFDNFGQQALEAKNLLGKLSADITASGNMNEAGSILKKSLKGTVHFDVIDGELKEFEPLQKIGNLLFKSRNMDHIYFKNISNTLILDDGKIVVPPMNIVSSALYMKVQGIYNQTGYSDMAVMVPLRNPQKEGFDTSGSNKPKMPEKKGLTLYLRGKTGDDGKINITWDPGKKGFEVTDSMLRPYLYKRDLITVDTTMPISL